MVCDRPPRSLRSRLPLTRGRLRFILPLREGGSRRRRQGVGHTPSQIHIRKSRRIREGLLLLDFAGTAAKSFLLNPADYVRRAVLDGNVSRFGRTKKHHCIAIDKRHICKVERYGLRLGGLGQHAFHFRNVFLRELAAQANLERLFVFSSWGDL